MAAILNDGSISKNGFSALSVGKGHTCNYFGWEYNCDDYGSLMLVVRPAIRLDLRFAATLIDDEEQTPVTWVAPLLSETLEATLLSTDALNLDKTITTMAIQMTTIASPIQSRSTEAATAQPPVSSGTPLPLIEAAPSPSPTQTVAAAAAATAANFLTLPTPPPDAASLSAPMKNPFYNVAVGDIIEFGNYEQDNDKKNGPEPIEWRVAEVSDGSALLISQYGLDIVPYHTVWEGVTWEKSTLRQWLNHDFLESSFDPSEARLIKTSELQNSDNVQHGTRGGNDTNDRIFVLSASEIELYLKGIADRMLQATEYARAKGVYKQGDTVLWWLRTPGSFSTTAEAVYPSGAIEMRGYYAEYDEVAVRPVLRIFLDPEIGATEIPSPVQTETAAAAQLTATAGASYISEALEISRDYQNLQVGDIIELGQFEQDNNANNGPEPVEWRVLEVTDDSALLVSVFGLAAKPYHAGGGVTTWEKSTLRDWLNNAFYDEVFSDPEKLLIQMTLLTNPDNPESGIDGGEDTEDRVFLLSLEEAEKYFADNDARRLIPSASAIANHVWQNGTAYWWLRTPGNLGSYVATVVLDGKISAYGFSVLSKGDEYTTRCGYTYVGYGNYYCAVRPAIRIRLP